MSDKSDYVWNGETWWMKSKGVCPDCGSRLGTNGTIVDCVRCEYWEVIDA